MDILPRINLCRLVSSFALLLIMVCADLAYAERDLIVAQPITHNVLRFDGLTGAAKGVFIAAGAG